MGSRGVVILYANALIYPVPCRAFPLPGEALRKFVAQPGVFSVNHANPKQNGKDIVDISTLPWYTAKDKTKRRLSFMIQRFDAFVSGITSCYKYIQRIKAMEMTEFGLKLRVRLNFDCFLS